MTPEILDRFQKLLRLALDNPAPEEGRSAAMKICLMLREHMVFEKVFVQPKVETPSRPHTPQDNRYSPYQDPYAGPSSPFTENMFRRMKEDLERKMAQDAQRRAAQAKPFWDHVRHAYPEDLFDKKEGK